MTFHSDTLLTCFELFALPSCIFLSYPYGLLYRTGLTCRHCHCDLKTRHVILQTISYVDS